MVRACKKKKEELNIKYRKMYWLLGRNSQITIEHKLLLLFEIEIYRVDRNLLWQILE